MAISRARVELKDVIKNFNPLNYNPTKEEGDWNVRKMLDKLRKEVGAAKISQTLKLKESYESPGQKRRRKQRASELQREKQKLAEMFPERRKKKESNRGKEE
jgi:hypothetical protein